MKQHTLSVCLAGVLAGAAVCSFSCSRAPTPPPRELTPEVSKDTAQNKNEEPRQNEPGQKAKPTQAEPKKNEPKKSEPTQTQPKKTADPVVVSAETLAQAVQDDVNSAVKKYHLTELQVDGVVGAQSEFKGQVGMFRFNLMVKDSKTDKMVGFTIFCGLKEPLPKGDKRLDEFEVGKKVTVRGNSIAMGNGQVTLAGCIIVEGDKAGAKKESTKP